MKGLKYYHKADWEEDECLSEIPEEVQDYFEKLEERFNRLCEGVEIRNAAQMSTREREDKKIDSNDFIYGEIVCKLIQIYKFNAILLI